MSAMPAANAAVSRPPFRADVVGSFLRPARLKQARETHEELVKASQLADRSQREDV